MTTVQPLAVATDLFAQGSHHSHAARNQYIFFAVEDQHGRVEMVCLARYWPCGYLPTGEELDLVFFPLGQMLAIKEPRLVVTKNGFVGFDVVSPTDVIIIDYDLLGMNRWATPHPGTPATMREDREDYKALGNAVFAKGQYYAAINGDDTLLGMLRLNRAAAHLKVRNFHEACLDAMGAAMAFAPAFRARRRKPSSSSKRPTCEPVSRPRPTEWHGKVELCVANHIGPIEPKKLASREDRMGLVAKRDIAPGELLLVERAYAASDIELASDDDRATQLAYQKMEAALIAKFVDHPGQEQTFQALHGDPEYSSREKMPGHFIADVNMLVAEHDPLRGTYLVDVASDLNIAKNNTYPPSPMTRDVHLQGRSYYAIYPYAPCMLHSCIPNTMAPARIGDAMFIRARACRSKRRQFSLESEKKRNGGQACKCSACRQDAVDTPAGRMCRRELFKVDLPPLQVEAHPIGAALETRSIDMLMDLIDPLAPHAADRNDWSLNKFRKTVAELERTYSPGHGSYKPELAEPLWRLAVLESDFDDCKVALQLLKTAFAALGGAAMVKIKGVPHNALEPGFDFKKGTAIRPTMGVSNTLSTLLVIHLHIVATKLGLVVEASKWLRAALRLKNLLLVEPKDYKRFFLRQWTVALQLDVLETPRGRELFGAEGKKKQTDPEKKKGATAASTPR
ncbi:BQ2448_6040 [Microbotryum intermedium]|uniref:BQ2448_6040 protein n=1 Tax=Microbotryum intermedium TaxID=269621 RepID=A0A238FIJ8_9BASI|nr:BQ2448_6040 [Microbotryum intermedium]